MNYCYLNSTESMAVTWFTYISAYQILKFYVLYWLYQFMYSTCSCKHSEEGLCLENKQEENIFVNKSTYAVLCDIQSGILLQSSRLWNVYQEYAHTHTHTHF